MDLSYSKQDETFRKDVRAWMEKNVPKKDKSFSDLPPHDPERIGTFERVANAPCMKRGMWL